MFQSINHTLSGFYIWDKEKVTSVYLVVSDELQESNKLSIKMYSKYIFNSFKIQNYVNNGPQPNWPF